MILTMMTMIRRESKIRTKTRKTIGSRITITARKSRTLAIAIAGDLTLPASLMNSSAFSVMRRSSATAETWKNSTKAAMKKTSADKAAPERRPVIAAMQKSLATAATKKN